MLHEYSVVLFQDQAFKAYYIKNLLTSKFGQNPEYFVGVSYGAFLKAYDLSGKFHSFQPTNASRPLERPIYSLKDICILYESCKGALESLCYLVYQRCPVGVILDEETKDLIKEYCPFAEDENAAVLRPKSSRIRSKFVSIPKRHKPAYNSLNTQNLFEIQEKPESAKDALFQGLNSKQNNEALVDIATGNLVKKLQAFYIEHNKDSWKQEYIDLQKETLKNYEEKYIENNKERLEAEYLERNKERLESLYMSSKTAELKKLLVSWGSPHLVINPNGDL